MSKTFLILKMAVWLLCLTGSVANAQSVAISEGGTPAYSMPIAVPPGISGMTPNIGLLYSGGGVNGPLGAGWSIQGISMITRCPNTKAIDASSRGVAYDPNDKLCLDGQRLIQTNDSGLHKVFPQTNDSLGSTTVVREYRTEKDSFARIRSYGIANGTRGVASDGPAYFRVWTKSGQIYEYGDHANTTAKSAITITGKTVANAAISAISAWAVSRISDTLGNYIDFQYEQRDVTWGSGVVTGKGAAVITPGHEWNLLEIRYTGTPTQPPTNKVVFSYPTDLAGKAFTAAARPDRSEAYHQGAKNISLRRLASVQTYINWPASAATKPATALAVKTTNLTYEQAPVTNRSRLTQIQECVGTAATQCLPATTFTYSPGGDETFAAKPNFSLASVLFINSSSPGYPSTTGVIPIDFDGDGKSDLLFWSDAPANNKLYRSMGDGSFTPVSSFNITSDVLFSNDGCYSTTLVDINGDGVADLLRVANVNNDSGSACNWWPLTTRPPNLIFLSNQDGTFTRLTLPADMVLDRIKAVTCTANSPGAPCGMTEGRYFYVVDVDGDGLPDIVTTTLPATASGVLVQDESQLCTSAAYPTECTKIYKGDGIGSFAKLNVKTAASVAAGIITVDGATVAYRSYYRDATPDTLPRLRSAGVGDVNGDGLGDIMAANGLWRNDTDFGAASPVITFTLTGAITQTSNAGDYPCVDALDFNGDGRTDCLNATNNQLFVATGLGMSRVANFNLTSGTAPLSGNGYGYQLLDVNGDGRTDILRWADSAPNTVVYLSNGDGTFSASKTFNLNTAATQLHNTNGSKDFVIGDFLGNGSVQFLSLDNPAYGTTPNNQLFVKANTLPPDLLTSVVTGMGLKTDLTWVPLTNSDPDKSGPRYTSDRGVGNTNAAVFPRMDIVAPMYVVVTSTSDSGVGTNRVATEYSYTGLKAAYDGRGS